jgi:MFS family permease
LVAFLTGSFSMQFQVPQFIDLEPKIVGPLTLKQFFYIGGAAGIILVGYFLLQTWLWILTSLVAVVLAIVLAFVKYNGQSTPIVVKAAFRFFWKPRFYVWRTKNAEVKPIEIPKIPRPGAGANARGLKGLLFQLSTTTKRITSREKDLTFLSATHKKSKEEVTVLQRSTGERTAARRVDYR